MVALPDPVERALTLAERALARRVFGEAVALDPVRIRRRKWWPLQPRGIVMAPCGHIHFHPESGHYEDCFARAGLAAQGLFIHEMTHVWQAQQRGRFYLPLMRHPFCRYRYDYALGRAFARYGIEQQAEIVRHVHLMRQGLVMPGKPPLAALEAILPFADPSAG